MLASFDSRYNTYRFEVTTTKVGNFLKKKQYILILTSGRVTKALEYLSRIKHLWNKEYICLLR
ncbi:cytochrome P450 [Histoplasma capsulatum G186AR]|uniref:Cytochrome P450 n=1 Tax=Ajellomyces capsulatus TaxID=5037 RepID=A0A8H7YRU3_AJECA|nr:cytochrome P450 [Histoplasma capsulatum]QSS74004.1 cytochrome P450 [Histoplasma capsulatum G186AR]